MNYSSPQECGKLLVKRLIALPGDKVLLVSPLLANLPIISLALRVMLTTR